MIIFRWFSIMRNFSDKILAKIKTHVLCSLTFFPKVVLWMIYNLGKYGTARQATDDSIVRGGADKPDQEATKLGVYSTYSPRSSIRFLARCSNSRKPLKTNSEGCPSNQVSVAAKTSASDTKWRAFNCFFQSREQVVVRWGQIRRIGWMIKTLEAHVG